MNSFEILGHGQIRGDQTSEYIINVSPNATVKSVVMQIISYTHECGTIGIKDDKHPFLGKCPIDYGHGILENMTTEKDIFWNSISERRVVAINGSGGWSRSDYQLVLGE